MRRTPPAAGRSRGRRIGLLAAGLGLAVAALVVWRAGSSTVGEQTLNPLPAAPSTSAQAGDPAVASPLEGTGRPPAARVRGRKVWFAPSVDDEGDLPVTTGPLPESIAVDVRYPPLHAGDVTKAVMVLGVIGDTSTLDRLLVLDESWQVFELDLGGLDADGGGPTLSRGALSPDGTRMAVGQSGAFVVVDLHDLTRVRTVTDVGTRDLSWSGGNVVAGAGHPAVVEPATSRTARVVTVERVRWLDAEAGRPQAVRVGGAAPATLVLDGARATGCCAVVAWSGPGRVLYESRTGGRLRLLDWDTGNGRVTLVATIEPVLSNDWYLLTSYADLTG